MLAENTKNQVEKANGQNLKVKIEGLALFRLFGDTPQWKIFFPKAPFHPFKVIIKSTIHREGSEAVVNEFPLPEGTVIDFNPGGEIKPSDVGKIYDESISLDDLHERVNEEKLNFSSNRKGYAGFLNLNGAILSSQIMDGIIDKYEIWLTEDTEESSTKTLIEFRDDIKTTKLVADFEVDPTFKARINFRKTLNYVIELPFKDDEGYNISQEVTFSNDCQCPFDPMIGRNPTDFLYYYNIIDQNGLKGTFETIFINSAGFRGGSGCNPGDGRTIEIPKGIADYIKEQP